MCGDFVQNVYVQLLTADREELAGDGSEQQLRDYNWDLVAHYTSSWSSVNYNIK